MTALSPLSSLRSHSLLALPPHRGHPQGHRGLHQEPLWAVLIPAHEGEWAVGMAAPWRCSPPHPLLPPPQDWQEIVALYEKDNTYLGTAVGCPGRGRCAVPWGGVGVHHSSSRPPLSPHSHPTAELAALLVRNVTYEVPALRKQIARCQQAQQDLARREEECQLAAAELRERFYASCKQYGITVSPRAP